MVKYILFIFLILSCSSRKVQKKIEKFNELSINEEFLDSSNFNKFSNYELQTKLDFNNFENVLKALNIQYDGQQENELNLTYNKTKSGLELNIKGKGKAFYNELQNIDKTLLKNKTSKIVDSTFNIKTNNYKLNQSFLSKNNFEKKLDKKNFNFGFLIYILLGIFIIFFIYKLNKKW